MNKRTKITIATGIFPPSIGGPATYSKLLLDELPPLGIDVVICTFDSVRKYPKIIRHFLYCILLCKKSLRADLIYAQDPVSVGFPALICSKILRKKMILKVVGDYAWEQGRNRFGVTETLDDFVSHKQPSVRIRMLQKVEYMVAKRALSVITPSEYLKSIVTKWGISPDKIHVIYNAFHYPVGIERDEEEGGQKIISVGRLVPWKGFRELIEVTINLKSEYKNLELHIIGSGPLKEELLNQIKEAKAENYIFLRGQLSHKDVYKEIASSNLFVLYTSYEGFSHLILESMALGTPILTTKVGGNIEVITHLSNGYLIERTKSNLEEGLHYMLRNSHKAYAFTKQAHVDVGQYTEERMLQELSRYLNTI